MAGVLAGFGAGAAAAVGAAIGGGDATGSSVGIDGGDGLAIPASGVSGVGVAVGVELAPPIGHSRVILGQSVAATDPAVIKETIKIAMIPAFSIFIALL